MAAGDRHVPDWREAAAYEPLLHADRSLFAWEWLRRDPNYRAVAEQALSARPSTSDAAAGAESFGLVAFEPPHLFVPHARPLWRSGVHPFVVPIAAGEPSLNALDNFDLQRVPEIARLIVADQAEHLLLSDGLRVIRLDGPPGAFSTGPACLRYAIAGLVSAERRLLALRRFLALCQMGCFSRSLHRREAKAMRWTMMLRAHDALIAGADQRQIAQELFSRSIGLPRWRRRESSVRSRVQRLVGSARRFGAGGYRELLR